MGQAVKRIVGKRTRQKNQLLSRNNLFGCIGIVCLILAKPERFSSPNEDKQMKKITLAAMAAAFAGLTISAGATTGRMASIQDSQQSCSTAPAVARTYLSAQSGRKLTMPRSAILAEVTKETGADGEFAGLKPCDSGYPNAVRFYIDEVIKAGTDNSTPRA
jgi:hypothetical protein